VFEVALSAYGWAVRGCGEFVDEVYSMCGSGSRSTAANRVTGDLAQTAAHGCGDGALINRESHSTTGTDVVASPRRWPLRAVGPRPDRDGSRRQHNDA
jgi:hypothetical protein